MRMVTSLLHELHRSDGHRGLVTMCIAGGQGMAAVIERD
jgi:acetyl-CoA C-acetyltransferase